MFAPSHFSKGFTLVELVSVIVIVGTLSASAAPKFIDLRGDAEIAKTKAIAAMFRQGVSSVQTRFLLNGHTRRLVNLQGFASDQIDVNDFGFPIGLNKNARLGQPFNIGRGSAGCVDIWNELIVDAPAIATTEGQDYRAYRVNQSGFFDTCVYVLRTLGDTGNANTGKVRIIYNSFLGAVDFVVQ